MFGDWLIVNDVAYQLVDMAVNAGVYRATKLAQAIVGVEVDGIFGEKTLDAVNKYDSANFLRKYKLARIEYYLSLCRSKKKNRKFLYSWLTRVFQ
jgi:lysozyme family protein